MSQLYEARHIAKYLGINKNRLYHWIQTKRLLRPAILGTGRGGRSKFTFEDLLDLSLVNELYGFGFDLNFIKKITKRTRTAEFPDDEAAKRMDIGPPAYPPWHLRKVPKYRGSIWSYYKENRDELKNGGYSLQICRVGDALYIQAMGGETQVQVLGMTIVPTEREKMQKLDKTAFEQWKSSTTMIIINLLEIINDLETKTGNTY